MRITIRHGAIVACDLSCPRRFVTYSRVSLARTQAAADGWGRIKLNMLEDWKEKELGSDGRKKLDACPSCFQATTRGHEIREAKRIADKAAKKAAQRTPKVITTATAASPAPA